MGRVIAAGPGGRAQAPVRDDRCRAVLEAVIAAGLLDVLLLSPACTSERQARELRQALYRSGRYYCSCGRIYCTRKWRNVPAENNPGGGCPRGGQRLGVTADIVSVAEPDTGRLYYAVQFRVFDKRAAMREVVRKYGPDPNNWPYFARRKQLKEK